MSKGKALAFFIFLFTLQCPFISPLAGLAQAGQNKLLPQSMFTEEEIAWLNKHPVIRVAPDPDFPPVEFIDKEGGYHGIAADFIALMEQKLAIRFDIIHLKNWDEVIKQGKERNIDMFGAAVPTLERLQYMKFTQPFIEFPAVIIVRDSTDISPKIKNLEGLRVAVVSNYAAHDFIRQTYPDVPLEIMPDISSGLQQVSFGKVDAMVLNLASASYYIGQEGITNLKIFKDTSFVYDLSFATRSDWPLLNSILKKAVATISTQESKEIRDRWIYLKKDSWRPSPQLIFFVATLIIIVVFITIIMWNRSLQQQVNERTAALKKELADRATAEKEKELLQQKMHRSRKMAALGLLAGGVAHDLNNILAGVIGYPDLILLDLPKESPLHAPLLSIRESGERAAAVVADLLTIARGAASDKNVLNLNTLIEDYLQSPEHKNLLQLYPGIVINPSLATNVLNISCSESHIRKTLMNLLINGAEATQDGTLTISTANRALDKPLAGYDTIIKGEYVVLTVSDTGSGIPPEDLEHIFEPFYSKKKMGRSGTGLGLAVVWNSVQDHQGYINVTSSEKGTNFELYFPISREKAYSPQDSPALATLQGNGEKILIVDDEENIRSMASHMLNALGYSPSVASSGEEALAYLQGNQVDLLLLDMIMDPGMNGRETYEKALDLRPGQKALVTSGFSESNEVKRAQELGAGRYIRKPYTIEKIGEAIQGELNRP
ncbi:MAG: transporter substrate-binding domain-containing protein [Thermodesulfobacteriota bacterium]